MSTSTSADAATSTRSARSNRSLPDMSLTSRAMLTLGNAYRCDWAEADGGVIETEMTLLDQLMRAELRGDTAAAADLFQSVMCNVCLECREWTEHCRDPETHETARRAHNHT